MDFLLAFPYLLLAPSSIIPPFGVLNALLARGTADFGMSGGIQWEPFQITRAEWDELVSELTRAKGHVYVEPPEWVKSFEDWATWRLGHQLGIPPTEQRELKRLQDDERRWREKSRKAGDEGNRELMLDYHLKAIESGTKSSEIIERYRTGKLP